MGGIGGKKANQRQGRQATKKASRPCEHHSGRVNRQRRGQAPAGCLLLRFSLCRKRFNARGAGGGSPRQNNLRVSPLPRRGRGLGDRGQQRKLTAGAAGDQKGKPPLRAPQRQGQPATPGASPRRVPASQVQPVPQTVKCRGTCMAGSVNATPRQVLGMQGAKPLA